MDFEQHQRLENRLRALWEADQTFGDFDRSATATLQGYGPEILGFLLALENDQDRAWRAFCQFSGWLWEDIAQFQQDTTLRTWAFTLARRARLESCSPEIAAHSSPQPSPDAAWLAQFSEDIDLSALVAHWKRQTRQDFLKSKLSMDELELLLLRLGGEMSWPTIARIVGEDPPVLRKRFERLKTKLRGLAEQMSLAPCKTKD